MTEAHQNICRTLNLVYCKPYDVIYNQGDVGDSFYYILNGTIKQTVQKVLDNNFYGSPTKKVINSNNYKSSSNNDEAEEVQVIEVCIINFPNKFISMNLCEFFNHKFFRNTLEI